jgi:hypothetical protein
MTSPSVGTRHTQLMMLQWGNDVTVICYVTRMRKNVTLNADQVRNDVIARWDAAWMGNDVILN